MGINWKLRLRNKATLLSLVSLAVTFVWQGLGMVGIVPSVAPDAVIQWIGLAVNALALLGVVVDPTTEGIPDSALANSYDEPAER